MSEVALVVKPAKIDSGSAPAEGGLETTGERRRVGQIQRDDRGNAYVEWVLAPTGTKRFALELEPEQKTPPEGYDPYASNSGIWQRPAALPSGSGNTTRTDLRKLSEHIKKMRALEQRQDQGEEDTDD